MSEENNKPNQQNQPDGGQPNNAVTPEIDYEKLASIIKGKQTVTEDTVLKSYFKQQGLTAEEMAGAINAFKAQKAEKTPDAAKLQSDLSSANSARLRAEIEKNATFEAVKQGVDVKSIPYVIKMADFKNAVDDDGSINSEKLTEAVKAVLDDVPALKGTQNGDSGGARKIGGDGNGQSATEDTLRGIFGIKK
ncbi:MAG: hypothetical protein LUF33_00005 [Clostridiales bacterium]|nr:hypothetical protein [Clostridiales bacterium]